MQKVHGVGLNDWPSPVTKCENGRQVWKCPIYTAWTNMLLRCCSEIGHVRHPTYQDVSVCEEWLSFTNFRNWAEHHWVEGYDLDKDIIDPNSRLYSPETCCFVHPDINRTLHIKRIGELPTGVHFDKGLYKARICTKNGREYLGSSTDPLSAHKLWQVRKCEILESFANSEHDLRIKQALLRILDKVRNDIHNGVETKSFKEV